MVIFFFMIILLHEIIEHTFCCVKMEINQIPNLPKPPNLDSAESRFYYSKDRPNPLEIQRFHLPPFTFTRPRTASTPASAPPPPKSASTAASGKSPRAWPRGR